MLSLREALSLALGDVLTLLSAVSFAGHIVALSHYARRHRNDLLVAGQVMVVAGLALPVALLWEGLPRLDQLGTVLALLFTALAATVLVLVVQTWAQRHLSATQAAIILAAEPLFAALFAVLFSGETLGLRDLMGGGLVVSGMLLAVAQPAQEPAPAGAPAN
ncbi:MAG: hypothetical protein KatS3mg061_0392 [Dehalococcoidia bacterium]|nr:MAG: hypothetical protein KatS3mg061_0392 [Dehalococcoidia bacterium]